jgi:hypothetical protein
MEKKHHTPAPLRLTLQAEGAAIATVCILLYSHLGGGWGMFALLILSPDVFMLGYLRSPQLGAVVYNIGHSYLSPLALAAIAWGSDAPTGLHLALIWGAHIGADRAIGYGLKYANHFKDTHLGRV